MLAASDADEPLTKRRRLNKKVKHDNYELVAGMTASEIAGLTQDSEGIQLKPAAWREQNVEIKSAAAAKAAQRKIDKEKGGKPKKKKKDGKKKKKDGKKIEKKKEKGGKKKKKDDKGITEVAKISFETFLNREHSKAWHNETARGKLLGMIKEEYKPLATAAAKKRKAEMREAKLLGKLPPHVEY